MHPQWRLTTQQTYAVNICSVYKRMTLGSLTLYHCDYVFHYQSNSPSQHNISSRAPGLTSGLQGSVNVHPGALLLVPQWQCISSFVFYTWMRSREPENLIFRRQLSFKHLSQTIDQQRGHLKSCLGLVYCRVTTEVRQSWQMTNSITQSHLILH